MRIAADHRQNVAILLDRFAGQPVPQGFRCVGGHVADHIDVVGQIDQKGALWIAQGMANFHSDLDQEKRHDARHDSDRVLCHANTRRVIPVSGLSGLWANKFAGRDARRNRIVSHACLPLEWPNL